MPVRTSTADDAMAIGAVHVDGWRWGYQGLMPDDFLASMDAGDRRAMWERVLANEAQAEGLFVAEDDTAEIVGFVLVYAIDDRPGVWELPTIYVAAHVAGTGYGGLLMDRAVEHVHSKGGNAIELWVLDTNEPTRSFYEHKGWRLIEGQAQTDEVWGIEVSEVRYRLDL